MFKPFPSLASLIWTYSFFLATGLIAGFNLDPSLGVWIAFILVLTINYLLRAEIRYMVESGNG